MLGWSSSELCKRAGVSRRTLGKLENSLGVPDTTIRTLEKLRETFESAGIQFIGTPDDRPGIRISAPPKS